jgi:hypothetical protein
MCIRSTSTKCTDILHSRSLSPPECAIVPIGILRISNYNTTIIRYAESEGVVATKCAEITHPF